ncbi:cellulose binding domain-containing protein [Nonomuraea sp. NPDC005692]|uniref:cellulose binding domain-containing protein n=1 Tax=Nonomuraea sp. NPDC005692 TaxID=3157168 RepID=UPI0033CF5109
MTATRTADPTALDLPGGEGHGRGDALTFRCDEFWSTNELTINWNSAHGSWPGGFTGQIAIENTGKESVNGWTLSWSFPGGQRVTVRDVRFCRHAPPRGPTPPRRSSAVWRACRCQNGMGNVSGPGSRPSGAVARFGATEHAGRLAVRRVEAVDVDGGGAHLQPDPRRPYGGPRAPRRLERVHRRARA